MENIPTQSNTGTEKLEQELAGLEQEQKEKRGSDVELIQAEIEKIRAEIEQKKESSKELGVRGMKRVEDAGGEPGDVADTKNATDALNTKTEEAVGEVDQKAEKPLEEVVRVTVEPKGEPEAEKKGEEVIWGITEKRVEARKLQGELNDARKVFASVEKNDPEYSEKKDVYQDRVMAMQTFVYEAKKATLLKKGISEADAETDLGKYAREVLVPNFAVAEAAKIQDAKADETMLEKVKDSKVSQFIYGAVDKYRKLPFSKKLMLSAGLFGGALVAGTAGGAVGAVIGGGVGIAKLTQRILGGAGTAVGTEAMIQRSQQKWLAKEGWGKNRKEYVTNEIKKLREGVKKGEVKAESLEKEGGMKEVEEALEERKKLEEKFEKSRTIIAGIVGFVFGSGAVTQAVKNVGEWTGVTNLIFGGHKEVHGIEKAKEFAGAAKEQVKATVAPVQEKIIPVAIGVRGPEGALIDNFRDSTDLAKAFGWDGKSDLSEWAGAKAGELWNADAKEALKNPQILAQMEKLGFSKDADGYAKMAHRIGKGFIQIDPTNKHIKFTDMEYLKNTTKELRAFIEPAAISKELPSVGAGEIDLGTETQAPLQGAQKIMDELVDQEKLSEMEEKMAPHIKELADRLKENGLSPEEIMKYSDDISENAAKLAGIDLGEAKGMINIEALQKIMESSEGKLGVLLSKLPEIDQEMFKSYVEKTGGWEKFMNMPSTELFPEDGARASVTGFTKLGYVLKGLTGDAPMLHGTKTIREVMEAIASKEVFGGTAEELMEKIK